MKRKLFTFALLLIASAAAIGADDGKRSFVVELPGFGGDNRANLEASRGIVYLPRGTLYVDRAPVFTAANTGLTLIGDQTTIKNGGKAGNSIEIDGQTGNYTYSEPKATLARGEVGYLQKVWYYGFDRNPSTRFEGTPPNDAGDILKRLKRAVVLKDLKSGQSIIDDLPPGVEVGDDIAITDGPWTNDLVLEWRRVASITNKGVELDSALPRDYKQASVMAGKWPRRLTFRGITFAGPEGPLAMKAAVDVRFENCTFSRNSYFGRNGNRGFTTPVNCARIEFLGCKLDGGLHIGASHDILVRDCTAPYLNAEENTRFVTIENCIIGPIELDCYLNSHSWTLRNCRFMGTNAVNIYDKWNVTDCTAIGANVTVRGTSAVVRNLRTDHPLKVDGRYEGAPPGTGRNIVLDTIDAPAILIAPGTSGRIVNTLAPVPVMPEGWTIAPKP